MQENKSSFNLVNDKNNDSDLLKSINENLEIIAMKATGKSEEYGIRKLIRKLDNNKSEEMSQKDLLNLSKMLSDEVKEKEEDKKISDMNKRCNENKKDEYFNHDTEEWLRNL
ncbi:hypothetical protein [Anaerococcus hydrogenalis]|uniref:Uncharacterized protein n=1 Tax=Anaerococcus hydrogenalis TaxID=33029 RepID=A0A2N6UKW5_9FIRM|nr:hypothetical protein [Anaerococcus hydrogenalis]MDK7694458.1 hypothetical protein [Anaerococcus hydrogenalis]MDK7696236.1 hypothetical protein [Anaerococcus hydrogenalis]MDK7707485.1 hypothetical protein [Anaerococcus hydrogenalis]PMC82500.1 hypothetical protein CJ192_01860 [Anaerococcus hydrogenalis]